MEKLLGELYGHLGESFSILKFTVGDDRFDDASINRISKSILGRRGHREQFFVQHCQILLPRASTMYHERGTLNVPGAI